MSRRTLIGTLCVLPLLVLSTCAKEEKRGADGMKETFRVVMVTDAAGLGDKGFNDAGWTGVQRAVSEVGIEAGFVQSNEQADYAANLALAAQDADVVLAMGFLIRDAVAEVAPLYPNRTFLFVDGEVAGPNVASFDFKAQEGAYLGGILAAGVSKTGTVGVVLGMDIPPVEAYVAGYRAGVRAANAELGKNVKVLSATVGDFNDPAKGKSLTAALIAQKADVILQLAGNTGLGVLEAVKDAPEGVYAIGADIDQDGLVPGKVLTSVLKRIDVAVYGAIQEAYAGRFTPGHRYIGLAEGASGLTEMRYTRQHIPPDVLAMIDGASERIAEGQLTVPSKVEDVESFEP